MTLQQADHHDPQVRSSVGQHHAPRSSLGMSGSMAVGRDSTPAATAAAAGQAHHQGQAYSSETPMRRSPSPPLEGPLSPYASSVDHVSWNSGGMPVG